MRIVGRQRLEDFLRRHTDAGSWIRTWVAEAEAADWGTPQDIRERYSSSSLLADNVAIFNVKGNRYRLDTQINYGTKVVVVRWIGTHAEYTRRIRRGG